ncbi:MAG: 50S ribosomal protein L15 [Sphingomonadales bacterium]|nr:50S ribosomal protein L15 [Sphingomonadales bacterium]
MDLSKLMPAEGSVHKTKRIGRGEGSGRGGTSTKGHKGAQARTGYSSKPGFEGGQMPLKLRVPKFGFKSRNRVEYIAVNLDQLQTLSEEHGVSVMNPAFFAEHGFGAARESRIKILGRGELNKALQVEAHAFSASAKARIEAAGGSVTALGA